MKFAEALQQETIMNTALSLIKNAKREILVTMDVDEEIRNPLPETYHGFVENKARSGIAIARYGFGTKKCFNAIKKRESSVTFFYGGSLKNYQRMLIVDKKRGLFKIGDTVCITEFEPLIIVLVEYVTLVYNKGVV